MAGAGPSLGSRQILPSGSQVSEDGTGPLVPEVASKPLLCPCSVASLCPKAPVLQDPDGQRVPCSLRLTRALWSSLALALRWGSPHLLPSLCLTTWGGTWFLRGGQGAWGEASSVGRSLPGK